MYYNLIPQGYYSQAKVKIYKNFLNKFSYLINQFVKVELSFNINNNLVKDNLDWFSKEMMWKKSKY